MHLSFNNSFNTSFATNNNASNPTPEKLGAAQATFIPTAPTVTLTANTVTEAGKNLISHGPLTIDLTDLEKHM